MNNNLIVYWTKGMPLSFLRYYTLYSFRHFNPHWKIIMLHTDNLNMSKTWDTGEQKTDYNNKDYYTDALKIIDEVITVNMKDVGFDDGLNEIYKSDILRYWAVVKYSGIWSDMDIVYTNSVPSSLIDVDFICFAKKYYNIGFFGGIKGSNFFRNILNLQKKVQQKNGYQIYGSTLISRTSPITCTINNMDMDLIYYLDSTRIRDIFYSEIALPDRTIGVHWYGGDSISKYFEGVITPDNCYLKDTYIYKAIKKSFLKENM